MNRKIRMLAVVGCCLAATLLVAGCEGSDHDATTVDVTGTWRATYAAGYNTLTLAQSEDAVTGTYSDSDGGRGTLTGTVSGSTFSFTILETPLDGGRTWGSASVDGNTMAGEFSNTYGDVDEPFTAVRL